MADLTADAPLRILGEVYTQRYTLDTAADRTVYKGQPMIVDQNVDATGNIVQFVDSVTTATTDVFVGIAAEGKTVTSGAAEPTEIEVYVEPTIVGFKSAVFTEGADLGKLVTMSDSGTLSVTTLANPVIGKLHAVKDGFAFVALITPRICAEAGS